MRAAVMFLMLVCCSAGPAQWEMQDPHVTADLRGIDYVGGGVAWASGSHGTVLRTEDMGFVWQLCATPPDGKDLDFRGVQAFDNNTAIVMSSGPGDKSRLYKTTDGCQTWKLVFTNPDKEGFFDALKFVAGDEIVLLGDSVGGQRKLWEWNEDAEEPHPSTRSGVNAEPGEASFAASNSVLELPAFPNPDASSKYNLRWSSGTPKHVYMNLAPVRCNCRAQQPIKRVEMPVRTGANSSGVFSFGFRNASVGVAVGGDYMHPADPQDVAAISGDGGLTWQSAVHQPSGYRSAVAYDAKAKTWITVGPNGTDVSTDDGRNWRALKPGPGDAPDADKNWNALSLPFVVGPKGRIGILRESALGVSAKSLDPKDAK